MEELAFCVHGHFYQPARENPISGVIPDERGAMPYRNWNELIFHHCYQPNAELENFRKISFNFGPTLLSWMEVFHPETYQSILEQDKKNYELHGVGNALAQAYHHTILPIATKEDKRTQIKWGIADFVHRFDHEPSGMWLPETAVNLETLSILAEEGIQFTILAPWQAETEDVDCTQPYLVDLPGDKQITVFFYQQDLSTRISFDPRSTENADYFVANAVLPKLSSTVQNHHPKYLLVASDGELYGHHQPFRDKFLEHLMNGALTHRQVEHIFPALWLKKFPPTEKIKIRENTSWSCHHGVERWQGECSCTINSAWKQKLKNAIDTVASIIDQVYLETVQPFSVDPYDFRDEFIEVVLGRIDEQVYYQKKLGKITDQDFEKISLMMKAQIERQRMYTSCGWFFEDYDRIEPINVTAYAAQALYWTSKVTGKDYLEEVLRAFEQVNSWKTSVNGWSVFREQWKNAVLEFEK